MEGKRNASGASVTVGKLPGKNGDIVLDSRQDMKANLHTVRPGNGNPGAEWAHQALAGHLFRGKVGVGVMKTSGNTC